MKQLPVFVNLAGKSVVLIGEGPAAEAKRRLIERAGGVIVADCPAEICHCARIAFIALEDATAAAPHANRLRAKGMLVNVTDRPEECDFTTPAIVDRDPVLIAVSTGGASAGMAKAIRQRLEAMLPNRLGHLAASMLRTRSAIKARWPRSNERRRAIDAAMVKGGSLDPFAEQNPSAVDDWLADDATAVQTGVQIIDLVSDDPEELTLRTARLLGEADHIFFDAAVSPEILNRARADAERHCGAPPEKLPSGLTVYLRLHAQTG